MNDIQEVASMIDDVDDPSVIEGLIDEITGESSRKKERSDEEGTKDDENGEEKPTKQ